MILRRGHDIPSACYAVDAAILDREDIIRTRVNPSERLFGAGSSPPGESKVVTDDIRYSLLGLDRRVGVAYSSLKSTLCFGV